MTDALKEELWDLREQNDALRAQLAARDAAYRDLAAEHEARMAESDATIAQLREALRPVAAVVTGGFSILGMNARTVVDALHHARRIYAATGAGEGKT